MQRIEDLECRRCKGIYQTNDRQVMSVMVDHTFLSICPKCTTEVAALMGYTPDKITWELAGMKRAQTENNKKYDYEHGNVCYKCHKPFATHARIREDNASNTKAWHIECYE